MIVSLYCQICRKSRIFSYRCENGTKFLKSCKNGSKVLDIVKHMCYNKYTKRIRDTDLSEMGILFLWEKSMKQSAFFIFKGGDHLTKAEVLGLIKPLVIADAKKSGIPASLTAAQLILESGWLGSGLSKNANNAFGIKGSYNGASYSCKTREWDGKKFITVTAKFRKYPSLAESIADHSALLCKARYQAVREAIGYKAVCKAVQSCGYATDPEYANRLIALIEQYKLHEWDEAAAVVEQEIKLGEEVIFSGGYHYGSSSGSKPIGGRRKGGTAKVTRIIKGAAHPYHLIAVKGGSSNVYGWCDASDVKSKAE